MEAPRYQVALSFAGEQRQYVEEVARQLRSRSLDVFYDRFEQVELWGRNGAEAFHEVFARQSAHVVMFISKAYVSRAWPIHERRSALGRMITQQRDHILPVRFDDTRVPGLPDDLIYVHADDYSPAELAAMIAEKAGQLPSAAKASQVAPPRMTSLTGEVVFDYGSYNRRYVIGQGRLEFETQWSPASSRSIHIYNDPPSINGVALARGCESISQVANAEKLDYTSRARTASLGEVVVLRNSEGFYAALQVLGIKHWKHDHKEELRFIYSIQSDGSSNFAEFVDVKSSCPACGGTATESWPEKNIDAIQWDCLDYCGPFLLTGPAKAALEGLEESVGNIRLRLAAWLHRRLEANPTVTTDVVESLQELGTF